MLENVIDVNLVHGDYVKVHLVPLSVVVAADALFWESNAKKHNIGALYKSIETYGWIDPPKWDKNLNDSRGGIVFGNGRTEALIQGLIQAQREKRNPPRGIPTIKETGEWCIPIAFGVDQSSESKAIALGIDHNNLTMSGGDFSLSDISKLWENDDYAKLLEECSSQGDIPISIGDDAIDDLLSSLTGDFEPASFDDQSILDQNKPKESQEISCICPNCNHEFIRQM